MAQNAAEYTWLFYPHGKPAKSYVQHALELDLAVHEDMLEALLVVHNVSAPEADHVFKKIFGLPPNNILCHCGVTHAPTWGVTNTMTVPQEQHEAIGVGSPTGVRIIVADKVSARAFSMEGLPGYACLPILLREGRCGCALSQVLSASEQILHLDIGGPNSRRVFQNKLTRGWFTNDEEGP